MPFLEIDLSANSSYIENFKKLPLLCLLVPLHELIRISYHVGLPHARTTSGLHTRRGGHSPGPVLRDEDEPHQARQFTPFVSSTSRASCRSPPAWMMSAVQSRLTRIDSMTQETCTAYIFIALWKLVGEK